VADDIWHAMHTTTTMMDCDTRPLPEQNSTQRFYKTSANFYI